jgi:O-acetyl-ADP-ribose deacetylase (regulator of RNase III)
MTPTTVEGTVERRIGERVVRIVRDDITGMDVDAFVFDITEDLKLGAGHGSAIQQRGGVKIQEALDAIGRCPVGDAVITTGGLLKAKHIIHANGPKFCESDEEGKLRRATEAALRLADENGVKTLAFPPMGTGLYQVPVELSARVLIETVEKHLAGETGLEQVLFVVPDTRERGPFEARIREGA